MTKSSRISLGEIRSIFQLVGECCELGADPLAWRDHLLKGMTRILHCQVAIGGRTILGREFDRQEVLRTIGDFGWDCASERMVYDHWIRNGQPWEMPTTAKVIATNALSVTCLRREWVDEETWRRSPLVTKLFEVARIDDCVFTYRHLDHKHFLLLAASRRVGERNFAISDRRRLDLLQDEVVRHLGRRLESFDETGVSVLPPRMRQVLLSLLEGDSEKQAALKLGISSHTAHEHIKRLHRHFAVASRGELLSRCRRYWIVLQSATDLESHV